MTRSEISDKIKTIIASAVEHENFEMSEALTATDVSGWDSLTHMEIITNVEDGFGIKFKLRELNKLENIGSLLDLVEAKTQ